MGITVAVTRVACDTVSATQDITTTDLGGLTPKAAIFILTSGVTDGTAAADVQWCVGAVTGGSNQWAVTCTDEDGQGSTDNSNGTDDTSCVYLLNVGLGSTHAQASFSAWLTNGIRLSWGTNSPAAYLMTVIFFAGTDLSAYAGTAAVSATVDTATDITAPGFASDVVFCAGERSANIPNATTNLRISYGISYNGASVVMRGTGLGHRNNRGTSEPGGVTSSLYALEFPSNTSNGILYGVEISGFDSSGFNTIPRIAGAASEIGYLALAFGGAVSTKVGTYATPTSTGNDAEADPAFTPQFVMLGMHLVESLNTWDNTGLGFQNGISVFTSTVEFSNAINSEDGALTTNTQSLSDNQAINLPLDTGAAGLAATFVSFDANGWTLNYSDIETNAKQFWYWAIEEESVGGEILTRYPGLTGNMESMRGGIRG